MTKSERIAKQICRYLASWKQDQDKLVIGIDGYAGSGKTTIANLIGQKDSDVLVVHLDDFIKHWKVRKRLIENATDKSSVFEYDWYRYPDLERVITAFQKNKPLIKVKTYDYEQNKYGPDKEFITSKRVLLIDGIFLFHPHQRISSLIDKKIYLDIDFAKADKRRIAREKKKWGQVYLPDTHPDNWVRYFKQAYKRYIKENKIRDLVDVTIKL